MAGSGRYGDQGPQGGLWGAIGLRWVRLIARRRKVPLGLFESPLGLVGRLHRRPLFGIQGARDGFDHRMLDMEHVRGVMGAKMVLHNFDCRAADGTTPASEAVVKFKVTIKTTA
jgi:hypothetical protein